MSPSADRMRVVISPAALFVKVTARDTSGHNAARFDAVRDRRRQGFRLARAGARQDEQRPLARRGLGFAAVR